MASVRPGKTNHVIPLTCGSEGQNEPAIATETEILMKTRADTTLSERSPTETNQDLQDATRRWSMNLKATKKRKSWPQSMIPGGRGGVGEEGPGHQSTVTETTEWVPRHADGSPSAHRDLCNVS